MEVEKSSGQGNLFDYLDRVVALRKLERPLDKLNALIRWEDFRKPLEKHLNFKSQEKGGRRPKDPVLMFKMCILQYYYNLSDEETEFQVLDRMSFQRFLGLSISDKVPDAKTLWLFKERLGSDGVKALFEHFDQQLRVQGLIGKTGKIVDATIIEVPVQRNSREVNEQIKNGETPERFQANANMARQKDTDARWTRKHGKNYYGYKNHAKVDIESKLIESYEGTAANRHDSQEIKNLIKSGDGSVFGDSAYDGEDIESELNEKGICSHIHQKGCRYRKLSEDEQYLNRLKSRIRARVEHVFAWQWQHSMDRLRTIGLDRARRSIGLFNLIYNMMRMQHLVQLPQMV